MNRVFILGVGASRFAGYPLSLELWKFVRDFPVSEAMAATHFTLRASFHVVEIQDIHTNFWGQCVFTDPCNCALHHRG